MLGVLLSSIMSNKTRPTYPWCFCTCIAFGMSLQSFFQLTSLLIMSRDMEGPCSNHVRTVSPEIDPTPLFKCFLARAYRNKHGKLSGFSSCTFLNTMLNKLMDCNSVRNYIKSIFVNWPYFKQAGNNPGRLHGETRKLFLTLLHRSGECSTCKTKHTRSDYFTEPISS